MIDGIVKALATRDDLNKRLRFALKGLSYERQISIVTGWMSIEQLTECVNLQEEHVREDDRTEI